MVQNKFKLPHHTEQDGHGVFHRKTSYHKVTTLQLLNSWGRHMGGATSKPIQ